MYIQHRTYTRFVDSTEMLVRARLEERDRDIERIARANLALEGRPPRRAVLPALCAWLRTRLSGRWHQRPIGIPPDPHGGLVSTSVGQQ
jgi:hypothetical protein